MRKSNWLIIGIIVAASLAFLVVWLVLGFNVVNNTLDLVITIIWWVVVVAVCVGISFAEKKRKRVIRTVYIAPNALYNPELGFFDLQPGESRTDALQRLLQQLNYDFYAQCPQGDERMHFDYVVRTDKFAQGGSVWTGELAAAANPNQGAPFSNREQLRSYIG